MRQPLLFFAASAFADPCTELTAKLSVDGIFLVAGRGTVATGGLGVSRFASNCPNLIWKEDSNSVSIAEAAEIVGESPCVALMGLVYNGLERIPHRGSIRILPLANVGCENIQVGSISERTLSDSLSGRVCKNLKWRESLISAAGALGGEALEYVSCAEAKNLVNDFAIVAQGMPDACVYAKENPISVANKGVVLSGGHVESKTDEDECDNLFWSKVASPVKISEANEIYAKSRQPPEVVNWSAAEISTPYDRASWLSNFSDFRVLDLPVIPGTHNSASHQAAPGMGKLIRDWTRNQHTFIADQLLNGVRFLDLRLHARMEVPEIRVSHTIDTIYTLDRVVEEVSSFLLTHPSEFVVLFVQSDSDHPFVHPEGEDRLLVESTFRQKAHMLVNEKDLAKLTVREAAGKMILLLKSWEILPQNSDIPNFHAKQYLNMCDLWYAWTWNGPRGAGYWLKRCMDDYAPTHRVGFFGVAVDFTLRGRPQMTNIHNREFFSLWKTQRSWRTRRARPVGIVMMDALGPREADKLLQYAQMYHDGGLTYETAGGPVSNAPCGNRFGCLQRLWRGVGSLDRESN